MSARRVLLLCLASFVLARAPALARPAVSLDGTWECVYGEAKSPPAADASWEQVQVPSVRSWRPQGPHTLWFRKWFALPSGWSGRRVWLLLGGARYGHRVYLNGKEVGERLHGSDPTEYDVTKQAVIGGYNELLIAVQDWTALLLSAPEGSESAPATEPGAVKSRIIAPLGEGWWETGISGSVSVEARPRVYVADAFVVPSVREHMLRVHVTVRNSGVSQEAASVTARVATGGPGPRMPPRQTVVPAGKEAVVTFEALWLQPRLWSHRDPHLYSLVAGARAAGIGDSVEVRFGFREFRVKGDRFLLNETPINLLAVSALPMPAYDQDPGAVYEIVRSLGCVAMVLRGEPRPAKWYDAADAAGVLLVSESALWQMAPSYALAADAFWSNAREHLAAMVRSQRNHPSIIAWSAADELLSSGGAQVADAETKLGGLADAIRQADPSRPVMFAGDADPAGKADIISLHRPHEFPKWNLWPQAAYWFDSPVKLDGYPGTVWQWDRSKPLFLGEFGWISAASADAASVLFGDAAYPDVAAYRARAQAAVWVTQIAATRDAGVSGVAPWDLWDTSSLPSPQSEALQRAYLPLAVVPREPAASVFAGTVIERTLMAFNDTAEERPLEVRWRLAAEGEAWQVAGAAPLTLPPAGRERVAVSLAIPAISADVAPATFTVELWENGSIAFTSSQDWKLWGRDALSGKVAGGPSRVAVYDPQGDSTRLLEDLGIECLPIDADSAHHVLRYVTVAVVGKGAFSAAGAGEEMLAELDQFVRRGGTLLVFEQEQYPPALIPVALSDVSSTLAFPRLAEHPALAGLDATDLAEWHPDGLVGVREIVKPDRVGFLAVVDSGGANGLETAGLAELRVEGGTILLCQLDVTRKFRVDPAATRVLRNLLTWSAARPAPAAATGVFCDDAAAAQLDSVGLRYDRLAWPLPKGALHRYRALLILDAEEGISEPARVRQFVQEGGRVVLHGLTPRSLPLLEALLGQPIVLREARPPWVTLNDRGGPAAGLSNQELAWFQPAAEAGGTPLVSRGIAEYAVLQPPAVAGRAGPPLTFHAIPGLLVSSPLGRGLWVLDQVRWEKPGGNQGKAKRYLATLLTNLGCEAQP